MDTKKADMKFTPELLDALYGYAYARCESSHEAGELCSDIVYAVLKRLRKGPVIESFYAYVWGVARRVYADFCEKRRIRGERCVCAEDCGSMLCGEDFTRELAESSEDEELLKKIGRKIAFLSRVYREVTVMFYLDAKSVSDISHMLGISENAVKQRLFSARNSIRKGIEKDMELKDELSLKPIHMMFWGNGDPLKGKPQSNANRTLSQCVLYLCKDTPKGAKEISQALNVPMMFIEEELDIACRGTNGENGLLKKLENGKYLSTFIMLDCAGYAEIRVLFEKYLDAFADRLQAYIERKKDEILAFPFLNAQDDIRLILWSLIPRMSWQLGWELESELRRLFYADMPVDKKDYYVFGYVNHGDERYPQGYGCDGVDASNVCGYSRIYLCNIYGQRKEAHFHCGLNVSAAPQIQLTLRAISGLDAASLNEDERETAAKAIESGYIKKEGGKLVPKVMIIPMDKQRQFYALAEDFKSEVVGFAQEIAGDYNALVKNYLPAHLYGQLDQFVSQTTHDFMTDLLEKCIERGILNAPESPVCAEGTFIIVEK